MLSELIKKEETQGILDKLSKISEFIFYLLDDGGTIILQNKEESNEITIPSKEKYLYLINQIEINPNQTIINKQKDYIEYACPVVINDVISGIILGYQKKRSKFVKTSDLCMQLIKDIIVQTSQKEFEINNLASEIASNYEELTLLYEISSILRNIVDIKVVANTILQEALHVLQAKKGSLMLMSDDRKYLKIVASVGIDKEIIEQTTIKVGEGIAGYVAQEKTSLLVEDITKEKRIKFNKKGDYKTTSFLSTPLVCVPLKRGKESIIGVISISEHEEGRVFTSGDLKLLSALADQAAIAIENACLFHYVKELFLSTVSSLTSAIDAKDHYTKGHSEEVMTIALAIAKELKFSEEEMEKIQLGALLHDIGKIGIPEKILLKSDKLSLKELNVMRKHPVGGVEIMKHVSQLAEIIPAMASHHERYDGKGYPQKLKGKEIPLSGRIISVADAFSAMTSDRPYRKKIDREEAINKIIKNKGKQFDPVIVDALVRAYNNNMLFSAEGTKNFEETKKMHPFKIS